MRRYIKLNLIISVFAMCLLGLGCKSNAPKYESKYQAVYEYINNCENLVFWKGDICSEKYKDQFPINIFTQFLPEADKYVYQNASGLQPLINYIFNRNIQSDLYVAFSSERNNVIRAILIRCPFDRKNRIAQEMTPEDYIDNISAGLLFPDVNFIFTFNRDNSIKTVSTQVYDENIEL
ncbi:hypothetical protein CE91St16_00570 [Alistipes finegoldii]|jgi:lipoprotein|uniref:Lipoprotein n=2 Tax=Alistipes finegoldii TaxID=214856 RepID=A0AA37KLE0_9BACT|nr:hypothetical protein [Alistipes finegoldii]BDF62571.1 hypothetical protein CE91St15_00570 [Alistipes finegoldii]GKI17149.1 hypothetical protein CE91St16_00570 [Alistipes finegoldii]